MSQQLDDAQRVAAMDILPDDAIEQIEALMALAPVFEQHMFGGLLESVFVRTN
jgi:hypothetical protein